MKYTFLVLASIWIVYGCNSSSANKASADATVSAPEPIVQSAVIAVEKIPSFNMTDANGAIIDLASFKGKKVFVNLWASWCRPCRFEMPSIQALYEKTRDKNVQFVMLALDDNFNKSLRFVQSSGFNFPVYYPAGALPSLLNVQGIPSTFIFNEKGELMKHIEGGEEYNTDAYVSLLSE